MKQYSLSIYDTLYPLNDAEGHSVLLNGLYGAMDVVTAEEAALIADGRTEELCAETAVRLRERGHLIPEGMDETENAGLLSRIFWLVPYRRFLDIVVLPTYNCNFRCSYCFERCRLENGQEWLAHKMSEETVDAVIAQLETLRKRGVSIRSLTLFGGEPLLPSNADAVKKWIDYCARTDTPYLAVSNGYELDFFLDMMREYPPKQIQITVDGPAEVHDQRRFLAVGKGSFSRIMDNIGKALALGIAINVRTNVNRSNLQSCMTLPAEFRRRGFTDSSCFSWYFKCTTACFEDDPKNAITDEELFREMQRAGFTWADAVRHNRVYEAVAASLTQTVGGEMYPVLRPAYCGANADMITVDPDGVLYACWDTVSLEEYAVGYLDTERQRFLYNFSFPKWRNRTSDKIGKCRTCPYIMLCGGGCAVEAEHMNGTILSPACGDTEAIYREILPGITLKAFEKNENLSLGLSWFDLFGRLTEEERNLLRTTVDSSEAWQMVRKYMTKSDRIFP